MAQEPVLSQVITRMRGAWSGIGVVALILGAGILAQNTLLAIGTLLHGTPFSRKGAIVVTAAAIALTYVGCLLFSPVRARLTLVLFLYLAFVGIGLIVVPLRKGGIPNLTTLDLLLAMSGSILLIGAAVLAGRWRKSVARP